jgi:serine/threonine protein phosphatase PrpC
MSAVAMTVTAPITWASYALSHIGNVRKVNEDAFLDRAAIGLWAVADGMGGHAAGDVASQMIVSTLNQIELPASLSKFTDAVEDALMQVNQELVNAAQTTRQTSGSTVVALLCHGRHCVYIWAGDSRGYLLRDGVLTQLTTDHSQVEIYVQLGLISRDEALSHPSSNMVTRAIGAERDLYLDLDMLEIRPGDRYLLCSDGLHKHIPQRELGNILGKGSPATVAHALVDITLARGASDNVTVAIVDIAASALDEYPLFPVDVDATMPDVKSEDL